MKKILLIEDNEAIRENTAEILQLAGYDVTTAADGKEGVEKAFAKKPDLVICDIMMPILDGYGVLHMIQKNKDTQNTPFIFVSAKTEHSDIRKGMEIGADDYLTKPFSAGELVDAIQGRLIRASSFEAEDNEVKPVKQYVTDLNSIEVMKEFLKNRKTLHFKRKQLIYSEGNNPSALYYILTGQVKTFKTNENGKELTIDLLKTGQFLGYAAVLESTAYNQSAIAITDTEISILPLREFEDLIRDHYDILKLFVRMMALDIIRKEEHMLSVAYDPLRKKVAEALLKLHRNAKESESDPVKLHINRNTLASIAGTATESLIRTLSDFKDEHLIEIKKGGIEILNEMKLATISS